MMGKKAPFWLFVEEMSEKFNSGACPPTFSNVKQWAHSQWPKLSAEERERYRRLSKQDRISASTIQYQVAAPTPTATPTLLQTRNVKEAVALNQVLEKRFILVDTTSKASVLEGGEIALAGFTLKDGVNKFLSAHILPSNETLLENSKEQLRLPTSQQSTIVVTSRSEVLTEVSQFCNCQQCSAGKIVMFAKASKVEVLRDAFRNMLKQEASFISIIVDPIEKLATAVHVALNGYPAGTDTIKPPLITGGQLPYSKYHRMPCSRHENSTVECAHRGVAILVFTLLSSFSDSLKRVGVPTVEGKHFLQCAYSDVLETMMSQDDQAHIASGHTIIVVPGPVIFRPGRGRLRTTGQILQWRESTAASATANKAIPIGEEETGREV